jgi:hypothetical protein
LLPNRSVTADRFRCALMDVTLVLTLRPMIPRFDWRRFRRRLRGHPPVLLSQP